MSWYLIIYGRGRGPPPFIRLFLRCLKIETATALMEPLRELDKYSSSCSFSGMRFLKPKGPHHI